MTVELPLGDGTVAVDLPDCAVTVADPSGGDPVDPATAAAAAVAAPHGPPLADVVDPGDDVTVVVTDATRSTPDEALLDALFDALPGRAAATATVVVGLGLHRPMTDAELRAELGPYDDRAVNHDPDAAVRVGTVRAPVDGADPCPVAVHPAVADADVVCSTGLVEPHQYAGFSGGAKTVAIGAGDGSLIGYTHGPDLLAHPDVRLGRIADNPFRETVDRAGDLVGPDVCVNVAVGPAGVLGASAGRPREVVADLASVARDALATPVDRRFDAVVAGVGPEKGRTLYQASRAITYLLLGDVNPVRPGGRVVVPARLEEGTGSGTGERRFAARLRAADDPSSLYESMREGYEPGAQRAFVLARALRDGDAEAVVVGSDAPETVEASLLSAAATVRDAVEPGSDVLVVPDALHALVVSGGAGEGGR